MVAFAGFSTIRPDGTNSCAGRSGHQPFQTRIVTPHPWNKIPSSDFILLVEDNADDVFFVKRAIKQAGIRSPLHVVSDGRQAIDYLQGAGTFSDRQNFPLPTVILLDIKLPEVSGLDVLRWIRSQPALRTLIVVMLTASSQTVDIDLSYQLGANSFLVKTASHADLVEMLKVVHDYWVKFNLPPPPPARSPQNTTA
jgi:CheY-like chemotaxis protein